MWIRTGLAVSPSTVSTTSASPIPLRLRGSSTLTSVLLEQGLVDEVVLVVYPVLLGRGKRFFSDSADPRALALLSTKATSTGVLMNTYRHVGSLPAESKS